MADILSRLQAGVADRYRVDRAIGQGGMATVYLADDLRHGRKVAIKLLTPELGAIIGGERFLSEIRVTANLQHPHILGLIDSGETDGLLYYVMPYVEGETLRARLDRERQLPVHEALRITREVGNALDYAHRRGVIHRDIKPENVLLLDGQAMVADFGIALAASRAGGSRLTETGLSLGTPSYMSPEQAGGERDLDARSDQYSLACMLYEMLAGQPPHTGPTVQAVIAAVLTREPEALDVVRTTVPTHVSDAVSIALAKLPADRFESTAQFLSALEQAGPTTGATSRRATSARGAAPRPTSMRTAVVAAAAMAALVLGVVGGWIAHSSRPSPRPPRYLFTIEGDRTHALGDVAALSPDGRTLVYWASNDDRWMLYARALDNLQARTIVTFAASEPTSWVLFFSPDSRQVVFATNSALRRVPLDGAEPVTITTLKNGLDLVGGVWTDDGEIVFSLGGEVMRVPAAGGVPKPLVRHGADSAASLHSLAALPGGDRVLCARAVGANVAVGVLTLATGAFHVTTPGTSPSYVAPDQLVFGRVDGSVWRQPFDLRSGDTTGPATRIGQSAIVRFEASTHVSASRTGVVSWVTSQSTEALLQLSDNGVAPRTLLLHARMWSPRLSPTARQIVFAKYDATKPVLADLWLFDVASGTDQRLSSGGVERRDFNDATWSRDGRWLVMSANDSTGPPVKHLYLMPADGSAPPRKLLEREGTQWPSDFSPDGKWVVFTDRPDGNLRSIWAAPVDGSSAPRALVKTPYNAAAGRISPDGKWLAFHAEDTGQNEVYVQPLPGPGPRVRISTAGGRMPVWSRGGSELYYATSTALEIATVSAGAEFTVTSRRQSLPVIFPDFSEHAQYDVSADGKRVVLLTLPAAPNRMLISTSVGDSVAR